MAEQVGISFGGDSAEARRHIERIIRELDKLSRHASVSSAAMTKALGGVSKEFGIMSGATSKSTKDLETNRREVDKDTHAFGRFSRQIIVANQALSLMGKTIAILKFPAMIVAVGYAVQAINALAAGAVALVGALSSLAGLAGAIPGAIITLGTAALTAKLAFNGLKEALDGNKEAFDKLTPEAQQFVKVLNGIKPVIKDLRQAAQQGLFPGLTEGLNSIVNQRNVAILRNNLKLMGQAMGDTFAELGKLIGSSGFARDLDFLLKSAARNFRILGSAAVDIVDAFRNIAVAAQPLVNYLTSLISRFGEWIRSSTEAGRQSGALARFFDQTKQTLQELGNILGPVGRALLNVFKIAAPYGHELLRLLGGASKQLQDLTESASGQNAIKKYFADAMPVLIEMGRLVRDVVGAFLKVGSTPELTNLIKRLRTELLPILVGIMDTAMKGFAPALVDAAIALAKLVAVVAGASGPLTQFVQFLGGIFKFAGWIIQNVPGATKILAAMFGIMAVNKIIPITRAIGFMVAEYEALAAAEIVAGTSSTVMSRLFSVAMKTMKAALVSTGVGIALLAIGLAAEYIMLHWEKVGPFFKALWVTITEGIKAAAYLWLNYLTYPIQAFLKILSLIPDQIPILGGAGDMATKALNAITGAIGKLKPNVDKVKDAWGDVASATGKAKDATDAYGTSVASASTNMQGLVVSSQGLLQNIGVPGGAPVPLPKGYKKGTIQVPTDYSPTPHAGGVTGGTPIQGQGYSAFGPADLFVGKQYAGMILLAPEDGHIQRYSPTGAAAPGGGAMYYMTTGGTLYWFGHIYIYPGLKVGSFVKAGFPLMTIAGDVKGSPHLHIDKSAGVSTQVPGGTSAITPSTPTFTGGTTTDKPSKEEVKGIQAEIVVFQRGVRRVLDPTIEKELRRQIGAIRKLLSGPVTASEMEKAKKLFEDAKALYTDGVNLNPVIQKLSYWDGHMGRFASLPKTQAAIREGIKRTRALIKKFTQKGSEGGIQITDEEQKQIENSFAKVGESVRRGLERANLQREFQKFKAGLKNVMSDALKSLDPPDAADIQARLRKVMEQYVTAMEGGFTGRARRLLARARELRAELVSVLAEQITSAKQRISSAWSDVMSGALAAFDKQTQRMLDSAEKAVAAAFGVVRGQTAASQRLAAFRESREEANIRKSQVAANKELADAEANLQKVRATAGVTPEDIASAEERLLAAKEALYEMGLDAQDRALQKEADAQEIAYNEALEAARKQVTEEREILRGKLEERMLMIQKEYELEHISAEEAQKQILELLGEYGIETTEAMGATHVFTMALEELGKAIIKLANVLGSVRELATPSTGSGGQGGGGGGGGGGTGGTGVGSAEHGRGIIIGKYTGYQTGGLVTRASGPSVGRDHVLVGASPGEVILNAAQQQNLLAGMSGGSPIIVQINRPLLLGRSLAVADQIAESVAPAINRRIGYRY